MSFGMSQSWLLYFLLPITGILVVFHFWFHSLRYVKLGMKLPGEYPLPIIGNAHRFLFKTPTEIFEEAVKLGKLLGKVSRVWLGTRLIVLLLDPRDIELVLSSKIHLEKNSEYNLFQPWIGEGLLISKGEKWSSHRKMIAPTFHQSILKTLMPTLNKHANELKDRLRKEILQVCDIHDYMGSTTVDILLETIMGVKKTKKSVSSCKYAKAVMGMCKILHDRAINIFFHPDFIFRFTTLGKLQKNLLKIIRSLTDDVIDEKKNDYFERKRQGNVSLYNVVAKEVEPCNQNKEISYGGVLRDDLDDVDEDVGEKKRLAFLDYMVEASQTEGNNLSDHDIRDEVSTIMFEGHDTTAAASSFFISILGVYPDIQEKVYQELKDIFHDSDRPITFNDTLEMNYLERVLLETLRLYSPVPIIGRKLNEDLRLVSQDYLIPKGTTVVLAIYMVHRDPNNFPNPDTFDPDNFLPERCQQRHHYSFVPFSAGPRSCVGRKYAMLKLKVILATVVRNFKITSVVSDKDFRLQADIILKRSDGWGIILENRKQH